MKWKKFIGSSKPESKAVEWFLTNQRADVSEEECLSFLAWLDEDAANQTDYDRVEATWNLTGDISRVDQSNHPVDRSYNWRALRNYAAALIVIVSGTVGLLQFQDEGSELKYQTNVGEQFVTTLEDGSMVHLNTATDLTVDYDQQMRHVILHSGEAFFDVEKDPDGRPFIVQTGSKSVRVVGTQFNIHISNEGTNIDVLEGTVELIETSAESGPALATIKQGSGVQLDPKGVAVPSEFDNAEDILAWQAGKLDFFADPLSSVVSEFNRYSTKQIIIADDSLKDVPISGSFRINEAPAFVEALKEGFKITVIDENGQFILKN